MSLEGYADITMTVMKPGDNVSGRKDSYSGDLRSKTSQALEFLGDLEILIQIPHTLLFLTHDNEAVRETTLSSHLAYEF